MNNLFPNWENSNKAIENEIMPNFNEYVALLKKDNQIYLYIGFLPANKPDYDDITEENWIVIKKSYDAFMAWADKELNISDLLKLQGKKINLESANNFRNILTQHVYEYQKEHDVSLANIFRACLGIGDIGNLPRQLQKDIYGEIIK